MKNKTILITGSTSGIGRISAKKFAEQGAEVIIHGRSLDKINETIEEIKSSTGNQHIKGYQANLSSLVQVKQMAEEILKNHQKIDVLINNAGVLGKRDGAKRLSEDNFELIFQVNYLATVLLTEKLLPSLIKAQGRIINISSAAQAPIDINHLMESAGMAAYAESKLAVILYSFHLAKELTSKNVSVFALDPGSLLNTNMVREAFGASNRSPEIGADAHLLLASSPQLEQKTGIFYCEQNEARAHDQAYDQETQEALWKKTQQLLEKFL